MAEADIAVGRGWRWIMLGRARGAMRGEADKERGMSASEERDKHQAASS